MSIHPTAIVSPKAQLAEEVTVGPYAIIEEGAEIGARTRIDAQAQVRKGAVLGEGNHICSGALVGADPQFQGFNSELLTGTRLGNGNTIREYATIHRSIYEDQSTVLGDENYLMTGAHVGHDCIIGSGNTLANNVLLGGHVELGSHCFLGGAAVFHQFVRIGDYALAQGMAGMSLDVPPYTIANGINMIGGINAIGLKRAGFDGAVRKEIKEAFRLLFRTEKSLSEVLEEAENGDHSPAAEAFYHFLRNKSKKGVCSKFGNT